MHFLTSGLFFVFLGFIFFCFLFLFDKKVILQMFYGVLGLLLVPKPFSQLFFGGVVLLLILFLPPLIFSIFH